MQTSPPKVILVVGSARSGSTLMGLLLARAERCTNGGELIHLWDRGIAYDHLCGCGAKFSACKFWNAVTDGKGWAEKSSALTMNEALVNAQRHHSLHKNFGRQIREPESYRSIIAAMSDAFTSMAHASGTQYIIDTSKQPVYARLLSAAIGRENLHIVHIVRDPRGVAFSAAKKKKKSDTGDSSAMMKRRTPLQTVKDWMKTQMSAISLNRVAKSYQTIRYEQLCADPTGETARILDNISLDLSAEFIRAMENPDWADHTVSGNPMRVGVQLDTIAVDDKWRTDLAFSDYLLVTALCSPLMLYHGFGLGR